LCHLFSELNFAEDGLEFGLVDGSQEPTVNISEGLTESGIQDGDVKRVESGDEDDVSKRDTFSNNPCAGSEVLVENVKSLADVTLGLLGNLNVVGDETSDGVQPGAGWETDLSNGEFNPLINQSILVSVLSEELGRSESGNITSDGIAFEDGTFGGVEDWDLSEGILLQELSILVVLSKVEGGDFNVDASVFGSYQRLVDEGILWV